MISRHVSIIFLYICRYDVIVDMVEVSLNIQHHGAESENFYQQDIYHVLVSYRSTEWKCPDCGSIKNILQPVTSASDATKQEAKDLASQINFQVCTMCI